MACAFSYPIIKRRIAWLIGKWISSECASPNNPKVWEVLVYLLHDRGDGSDAVVRLTAAAAIKECVDVCFCPSDTLSRVLTIEQRPLHLR
jgi:hypothetical protein